LHQRFGKLSWQTDLAPAIACAEGGFTPDKQMERQRGMEKVFAPTPTSAILPQPGFQLGLSTARSSLPRSDALRSTRPKGFYQGKTADLIVA